MTNKRSSPLSYAHRADLFGSLAKLENAGIPIDSALATIRLAEPIPTRISQMRKHLVNNKDLATSGYQAGLFTSLEAELIRVATATGSPAITYVRFSQIYAEKAKLKANFKSQMNTPIFMIVLSAIGQGIVDSLKDGNGSHSLFWNIARPIILIIIAYQLLSRFNEWLEGLPSSSLRNTIEQFLTKAPYVRYLVIKQNTTNFFESLGMMLEAGLTLQEALPKATQTMGNLIIRREFSKILPQVKMDKTLSQSMTKLKFIDNKNLLGLIIVGETTGTLPKTLSKFAVVENEKISLYLENASRWIPKIAYAMVSAVIIYNMLAGGFLDGPKLDDIP